MALTKITRTGITDNAVNSDKINNDSIDATKIADNAISEEHLDNTAITGHTELSEGAASGDVILVFDTSAGTIKKISQTNFINFPSISSVSPTSALSGDGTGNYTFTITGTNFTGGSASLVNTSGNTVNFDTVTVDSATQITAVIAKSSLPSSGEPYDVKVTASTGLAATLENQINIDQSPTYNTAAGSLGTVGNAARGSTTLTVEAFDPESAGNVTFEIQSGSLPAGVSTTTVNENGVSKFQISGFSAVGTNTTSNFVLRAVDAASNTSSRSFSITVNAPVSESFTSSGTFSVPSGVTTVDVLVVAGGGGGAGGGSGYGSGGGGGAGGLVFFPGATVTPGGTVSVTVGCGGGAPGGPFANAQNARGCSGSDSVFGASPSPGITAAITAKGGGTGGGGLCSGNRPGVSGGSGGGAGAFGPSTGGSATQPTQPGNSGAYGFGNSGGSLSQPASGAGGGGAGAAGSNGGGGQTGTGGIGKAYTIADGTTSVYYAGGGGGGAHGPTGPATEVSGGQGGGGTSGNSSNSVTAQDGQANKGGGGGGGGENPSGNSPAGAGGKGIVIVRY